MRKKLFLLLAVLLVVIIPLLSLLFFHVNKLQKEAASLDATVDWKAVATGKKPIYQVVYKVVKIKSTDLSAVERKIEELHLQVDIWNDEGRRREFLFGGATDTAIRELRGQGYTVEVLYNSYDEYLKAVEQQ